ncbi:hypothetical protein F7732_08425 [Bacillus mesophilum]|uniref:Uncharacterized protein n=1 Tax=Bacillus mesophilum TaxID=1071718 RepID=A0A7V7RNJ6_9BACI|nr:hypothetical protein F7732_08425 [Bacillus mesophilum]
MRRINSYEYVKMLADCSGVVRDSCGRSGKVETPQVRMHRGGSTSTRGKRVPRSGKQPYVNP